MPFTENNENSETLLAHIVHMLDNNQVILAIRSLSTALDFPFHLFSRICALLETQLLETIDVKDIEQLNKVFFANFERHSEKYTEVSYQSWKKLIIATINTRDDLTKNQLLFIFTNNAKRLEDYVSYVDYLLQFSEKYRNSDTQSALFTSYGMILRTATVYDFTLSEQQKKYIVHQIFTQYSTIESVYSSALKTWFEHFTSEIMRLNVFEISLEKARYLCKIFEDYIVNIRVNAVSELSDIIFKHFETVFNLISQIIHLNLYRILNHELNERSALKLCECIQEAFNIYNKWTEPGRIEYAKTGMKQILDILNGDFRHLVNVTKNNYTDAEVSNIKAFINFHERRLFLSIRSDISKFFINSFNVQGNMIVDFKDENDLQEAHHLIKKAREILGAKIDNQTITKFNETIINIVRSFLERVIRRLGQPPCTFNVFLGGSGGRNELAPCSDLEFFIVYEIPERLQQIFTIDFIDQCKIFFKAYFMALCKEFEIEMRLLGETRNSHIDSDFASNENKDQQCIFGIRLDDFLTPLGKEGEHFIGTENEIINFMSIEKPIYFNLLFDAKPVLNPSDQLGLEAKFKNATGLIFSNNRDEFVLELYKQFLSDFKQKGELFNSENEEKEVNQYVTYKPRTFDVKILRNTVIWIVKAWIVSLSPDFTETSTISRLEYLKSQKIVNESVVLLLLKFLEVVNQLRARKHLDEGFECDRIELKKISIIDKKILQIVIRSISECLLLPNMKLHLDHIYERLDDFKNGHFPLLKNVTNSFSESSATTVEQLIEILYHTPSETGVRLVTENEKMMLSTLVHDDLLEPYHPVKNDEYKAQKRILVRWMTEYQVRTGILREDIQKLFLNESGVFLSKNKQFFEKKSLGCYMRDGSSTFCVLNKQGQIVAYFKSNPKAPGTQLAVDDFMQRLTGYGSYSILCHFIPFDNEEISYPVLITRSAGQSLSEIAFATNDSLETNALEHALSKIENDLDPHYFALTVIARLILVLKNDNQSNVGVEYFQDDNNNFSTRLISFSATHALDVEFFNESRKFRINANTILFCFDRINGMIPVSAMLDFSKLDVFLFLNDWLKHLIQLDYLIEKYLFSSAFERFQKNTDKNLTRTFLNIQFEQLFVSEMYQRMLRLHDCFTTHLKIGNASELDKNRLLNVIYNIAPTWIYFYQKTHAIKNGNVFNRFDRLQSYFLLSTDSNLDARERMAITVRKGLWQVRNEHRAISPIDTKMELLTMRDAYLMINDIVVGLENADAKQADDFFQLATRVKNSSSNNLTNTMSPYLIECIVNTLDFGKVQLELQSKILSAIVGIPFIELTIRNSSELVDNQLSSIIKKSPNLVKLDITGCQNKLLKGDFIENLLIYSGKTLSKLILAHSSLQIIDANYHYRLTRFLYSIFNRECFTFQALELLDITACKELKWLRLRGALVLKTILAKEAANLVFVAVDATSCVMQAASITADEKKRWEASSNGLTVLGEIAKGQAHPFIQPLNSYPIEPVKISYHDGRYKLKLIMLGSSGCGKSAICNRFTNNVFLATFQPTSGVNFFGAVYHQFTLPDRSIGTVVIQVWDTAGQESYRAITRNYYRDAQIILLCFDITSLNSFENVKFWLSEFVSYGSSNPVIILVGTKSDLNDHRRVDYELAENFAQSSKLDAYFETSARNGVNIEELFQFVARRAFEKIPVAGDPQNSHDLCILEP